MKTHTNKTINPATIQKKLHCGEQNIIPGENTEKFYKFLGSLYNYATKHGGIDPQLILDPRGGCRFKDGNFIWDCTDTVRQWFEALGPAMRIPLDKYIGEGCQLFYGKAS